MESRLFQTQWLEGTSSETGELWGNMDRNGRRLIRLDEPTLEQQRQSLAPPEAFWVGGESDSTEGWCFALISGIAGGAILWGLLEACSLAERWPAIEATLNRLI
jgi:hypothetical protein